MKMSDVFTAKLFAIDNEDMTGEDAPCLCHKGGGYYAVFNTGDQAQAAAHAINQYDELVVMNAELVEALELAVQSMLDSGYRVNSSFIRSLSSALAKAKELSHGKG